jgi:hypothetical protein
MLVHLQICGSFNPDGCDEKGLPDTKSALNAAQGQLCLDNAGAHYVVRKGPRHDCHLPLREGWPIIRGRQYGQILGRNRNRRPALGCAKRDQTGIDLALGLIERDLGSRQRNAPRGCCRAACAIDQLSSGGSTPKRSRIVQCRRISWILALPRGIEPLFQP